MARPPGSGGHPTPALGRAPTGTRLVSSRIRGRLPRPLLVYTLVLALHLGLPTRWTAGYVTDGDGAPLRYRLNGLLVCVLVVALWALFFPALRDVDRAEAVKPIDDAEPATGAPG